VLRQVAAYLRQRLRSQDLLARWGGEEFLLLMPNTTLPQAQQLVDALRLGIRTLDTSPLDIALSATFGISPVETSALALEQAIKAADMALYQGKTQGRDQVVLAALSD
jgi:diguanylate cyclase (GGDEF)-like protein